MARYERRVEFAVGFVGGEWREVEVTVQEDPDRALDEAEVIREAEKIIEKVAFDTPVAFYHVLYIEDPEGGYADDIL